METNSSPCLSSNFRNKQNTNTLVPVLPLPAPLMPPAPRVLHNPNPNSGPSVSNGHLYLEGNPGPWIETNPASLLLVKHLHLNFSSLNYNYGHFQIADSIHHLTNLTHLNISHAQIYTSFPTSIPSLHSLQFYGCKIFPPSFPSLHLLHSLEFHHCSISSPILDALLLNITTLTHLNFSHCDINSLPHSFASLSHLTSLHLSHCTSLTDLPPNFGHLGSLNHISLHHCGSLHRLPSTMSNLLHLETLCIESCTSLAELPPNLGQLGSLKHISLECCNSLRRLPNTMSNLLHLETLCIKTCSSLTRLPPNLNVTYLKLYNCNFKSLPRGLINLRHFETTLDICSRSSFANLQDSITLHHLSLEYGVQNEIPNISANLNHLVNLEILSFRSFNYSDSCSIGSFTNFLEGLDNLIILDIKRSTIKYLPWSISKLRKLRFLMLPWEFRLHTLPFHLNDSVLVSINGWYIRRPWKQLKHELGLSDFSIPHGECPTSIIPPPGYLSLHEDQDLEQWVRDNYESRLLVNMLALEFLKRFDAEGTKESIAELPYLTHLFITHRYRIVYLPHKIKGLKHLYLQWQDDLKAHPVNLGKLSNLETLELIVSTFSSKTILPPSLRRLSLVSSHTSSLPASLAKLSNLQTLELSKCYKLTSLPPMNIVSLKIDCIIKSLPIGLQYLEILHGKGDCLDEHRRIRMHCDSNILENCLTQLVNLEMLSLTCYHIKSLPRMARQRNLRVLLLKDCFALKELHPDVEQLAELRKLNISGTRIISLPDSIIKLSNLQQLVLPRCFTQKLPRNLEKVAINDDTHKRYYEHMGYYDSDFETVIDTSCEGTYDGYEEVGSSDGVDAALTKDPIQGVNDEEACEQNHVIAQVPRGCSLYKQNMEMHYISENNQQALQNEVSMSTCRGRKDEFETWPSNKRRKHCHDAEGKPNTDSPCFEEPRILKGAVATIETAEKPLLESVKKSRMEVPQHVEMHLDGANQPNIARTNGSSSSFDFVKACYEGDQVWIAFSLSSSFDHLSESICKKFRLEVNTFKIKYLDEDKEWSLMTCISDLTHALVHTSSHGWKFVRLSIIEKSVVNIVRSSEENLERIIPKNSERRSTWVSIHFEREDSKYIHPARENSNQPSIKNSIPYPGFCLSRIKPFIEGQVDVKADGNCGFRVIALFEYGDEEKWLDVRIDLLKELNTNKDLYRKALGGDEEFERAKFLVNWLISPAEKMHWFEATCLGLVVATKYQKVFTWWCIESCTYLPLVSRLVDHKAPTMYINMAFINGNHFIALQMSTNIPLPPLSPLWKRHRSECDIVKRWSTSIFKKQLDDYFQLYD